MKNSSVLIVDSEPAVRAMIRRALTADCIDCVEVGGAQAALRESAGHLPDLIVMDWQVPNADATNLLGRLRSQGATCKIPVILLSTLNDEHSKLAGFLAGADDYITKPFSPRELLARVKAILRRSGCAPDDAVEYLGIRLDLESRRVLVEGQPTQVGPTEFRLLHLFLTHRGRALSRRQLVDHVWPANVAVGLRTVDVHIQRLRKALHTPHNDYGQLIETVRGLGYRFSPRAFEQTCAS